VKINDFGVNGIEAKEDCSNLGEDFESENQD
jgi:hypothetical protein